MNRRITLILAFGCFLNIAAKRSFSQSFVQTDAIKVSGINSDAGINSLTVNGKQSSRTYFDGMGRPIQTVALQAGVNNNYDIVQNYTYNNLGQQVTQYLPYADNNSSNVTGSYRTSAAADQISFYSNGTSDKVQDDAAPWSQQVFENSPLQRILNSGMAGNLYQPNSGSGTSILTTGISGIQHYKTINYRSNTGTSGDNVIEWSTDGNCTYVSRYGANSLSVVEGIDEDGAKTQTFTDIAGHTVLKRQFTGSSTYNDTYYIYNNAGMINFIIPPKAVAFMNTANNYSLSVTGVSNLIYKYLYDNMGRLTDRTMPGNILLSIVYDPYNRPVLIQDANLHANNQWNYIKYDVKGRPISQGIYTDATNSTNRAAMQYYVTATYGSTYYESRTSSNAPNYYTNNAFPTANYGGGALEDLAYSYYDDYDLDQNGSADYSYATQYLTGEATPTLFTRGMPTMVRKRTVGAGFSTPLWLIKVIFYDKYGHSIQVQSNNQLNTSVNDVATTVPDFVGKPLQTKITKVTASTLTVLSSITYDAHNSRVLYIDQQYNSQSAIRIAAYSYNELGQLITKKLGNTSGTTGTTYLQNVDYRYNIHGQVTTINNSTITNDGGVTNNETTDVFGMQLLYDHTDGSLSYTPSFTGKLMAVKWMTGNGSGTNYNERSFIYSYDNYTNRYTGATYGERTGGSGSFSINSGGYDESGISYDENGNISSLVRNAASSVGASSHSTIDNLTYTYDDSNQPNQLYNIADASGNNAGVINGSGHYTYDANGNMLSDPYKGLTLIYNELNRTDVITVATGQYINYAYDAGGALIHKDAYKPSVTTQTTDYIDGFVYNNGSLSYFAMPEGRVYNSGGTLKPEYIITDPQGNARVSFDDSGSGGTIHVRQVNSYYAFGMVMPDNSMITPSPPNANLYNGGSEWQNDYSNLPDLMQTFNRNYDAALGRFVGVDPEPESAESLSNYQYAGNNPIMFNDPMGNELQYTEPGRAQLHDPIRDMQQWEYEQEGGLYAVDPGAAIYLALSGQAGGVNIYHASTPLSGDGGVNYIYDRSGKVVDVANNGLNENTYQEVYIANFEKWNDGNGNFTDHYTLDYRSINEFEARILSGQLDLSNGGIQSAANSEGNSSSWDAINNGISAFGVGWGFKGAMIDAAVNSGEEATVALKAYGKITDVAGVAGGGIAMGSAGYNMYNQYQQHHKFSDIHIGDAGDFTVGAASVGASLFLATNPIGWAIGAGAALYFAGRFIYQYHEAH
jgi:RHS repeat-associated protein